ncbi:hypothetical protein K469DRAFT_594590 [Zopfia rhizophila CBS 207.26]|uniref:Uncharacterized protein n=1 Tax=Zopfia rhizophila CBS 207.26 TaxID=1314779 RepID=A0A6A6DNB8_9PEZI|nr:hypothetical protein K469DRAFT_594590 [Zopfia rhizophila CBS 207.26]
MASLDGSSGGASRLPKREAPIAFKFSRKLPRRQVTLIAITACLNVLLWSSLFTFITTLYLIAADPVDTTNIPTEVLTLTSSLASIAYVVLHTIFSLKQRIWKHQRRHPSILKKTSYFAIRLVVTLCILWLLTSGWNMITVARRPVCLPAARGLARWESGTTCVVGRLSVAMSLIALIASCTLFGMLAVVRRPFEAHLLKHGYLEPVNPNPTPAVSRRPSRTASFISDKYHGRASASTHRSTPSNHSNADVETLDLNSTSPPPTIHAPSPTPPPIFNPTTTYLPPPPRMSSLVAPSGFVPLSIPPQYSASTWRAVHPTIPSPLGPVASWSHPHLPHTNQGYNFSYRSRYSRSSVSLTRPHRLSSATPTGSVAGSMRSASTGPDNGRGSPSSEGGSNSASINDRATANAVAYAILNGTPIPSAHNTGKGKANHMRRASAPDTTAGAQQGRKAKGWKPQLRGQEEASESLPINIPRSSSVNFSRFSPDSSPEDNEVSMRKEFEKELDRRLSFGKTLPFRKIRSESPLRHSDIPGGAETISRTITLSGLPRDPMDAKDGPKVKHMSQMTLEELKNKPLPNIAAL